MYALHVDIVLVTYFKNMLDVTFGLLKYHIRNVYILFMEMLCVTLKSTLENQYVFSVEKKYTQCYTFASSKN